MAGRRCRRDRGAGRLARVGLSRARRCGGAAPVLHVRAPCDLGDPPLRTGASHLHRVTDNLYRGAQPSAEGMRELAKMGIKTVINLRAGHSDRDEIADTGLDYVHVNVKPWHAEDEDVVKFLQAVADPDRGPFFVHCKRGADRTGLMCAVYRVAFCGWTNEQAAAEMTEGGFDFAKEWVNIVNYMKKADVGDLMKQAGITAAAEHEAPDNR